MMNYLRLIRFQNLLFVAFVQITMLKAVIYPIMQTFGFETTLDNSTLGILILATVFIAAGGYVLNDYFDVKIDMINKPEKLIVGIKISKNNVMIYYQLLTGIGLLLGLTLAYIASSFTLGFIFIVIPGLLWFYSASYKRQFMIGNLVIAFIVGISVLIVGITQLAFLEKEFGNLIFETPIPSYFYGWVGGFSLFSFLISWIREIIKDFEDEVGDREMECRTLAIKWGHKKSKLFINLLVLITIILLFVVERVLINFEGTLTLKYIIWGLVLPFIALCYLVYKAKSPTDFHQASTLTKFIMLSGVLYSFVFYYLQAKAFDISIFNLFIIKQ